MTEKHKPAVIKLTDTAPAPHPADAPVISDAQPVAIQSQPVGGIGIWGWVFGLVGTTLGAIITLKLWDFAVTLAARNDILGYGFLALLGATLIVICIAIGRELLALIRLKSLDHLRERASDARLANSPVQAQKVQSSLVALYAARPELQGPIAELRRQTQDQVDGFAVLDVTENTLLPPLDQRAYGEIEKAARQVATVTALMPIPVVDVIAALSANIRMIRRIADVYGGRSGIVGSWRLLRAVMAHLVATGAVAVGDDWLGSIFGGSLLAKLSRRFGEGMINAALTARVGRAAIEVCRPMPFHTQKKPRVSTLLQRAMTGVFDKDPS